MNRILIVDDQKMQRVALESFFRNQKEYEVIGLLDSAELAVAYCKQKPVDLVLMDVVMTEGIDGIKAAGQIKAINPAVKIVLVTSMPEESYIRRAREAGVDSFWYKEYEEQPLLAVVERTLSGESVYPDQSPELILGNATSSELTEAELSVLRQVVTGATDQEIAEALHISVWTIRSHIQHMLQKTGYKNRVELAVRASTAGLIVEE